jgi:nickel/cobalt exporter
MPNFAELLQQGGAHAWLYFPSAILLGGMYLGQGMDAETTEPYFQLASSALIVAIALWMLWRTWHGERMFQQGHDHHHHHDHDHHHKHDHDHTEPKGLSLSLEGYQDAHEQAHANDIRKRFTNREVTTGQIILFGLTGGLIPCPAAITVLLLCLQVKEVALGGLLVLCFSIGLAITLVTVGAAAAMGARQASNRWPWLGTVARRAPYLSSVLIIGVGLYVGIHGWIGLYA